MLYLFIVAFICMFVYVHGNNYWKDWLNPINICGIPYVSLCDVCSGPYLWSPSTDHEGKASVVALVVLTHRQWRKDQVFNSTPQGKASVVALVDLIHRQWRKDQVFSSTPQGKASVVALVVLIHRKWRKDQVFSSIHPKALVFTNAWELISPWWAYVCKVTKHPLKLFPTVQPTLSPTRHSPTFNRQSTKWRKPGGK